MPPSSSSARLALVARAVERTPAPRPRIVTPARIALAAVLLATAGLRVYGLSTGVPYAVGIDEPFIVNHAVQILKTGDWNPHFFDYPSLVIYIQTVVAGARFLWGAAHDEWSTLAGFHPADLYVWARATTVLFAAIGVWLVYRLGRQLDSRWVGVLGAAFVALLPMHVRESHFALTDVPLVTFVILALSLALRAARHQTMGSFAAAGAAAGLAAATKYNGALVLVALFIVSLQAARSRGIWQRTATACGAAAVPFLCAAPYTVLDLSAFMNGFGTLLASVASEGRALPEPAWRVYLKHVNLVDPFWLPAALLGAGLVLVDRDRRRRWLPVFGFVAAYSYVLASNRLVFARYLLPIAPVLCLSAAFLMVDLVRRVRARRPATRALVFVPATLAMILAGGFAWQSIAWDRLLIREDTRTIVAEWLAANIPAGTRVAVENYGPTNLEKAGFAVVSHTRLIDRSLEWYTSQRVEYLIVSTPDAPGTRELLQGTETAFEIRPDPRGWGPPLRVVALRPQSSDDH